MYNFQGVSEYSKISLFVFKEAPLLTLLLFYFLVRTVFAFDQEE